MIKYRKIVLEVLSNKKTKSTNEILKNIKNLTSQSVNWHIIYHVLLEFHHKDKVDKFKVNVGFSGKGKKV